MRKFLLALTIIIFAKLSASAQTDSILKKNWSLHFQATVIPQYHFPFSADYTGQNSMQTKEPAQTSFTSTIYLGRRLWKNAFIFFNPEAAGGSGLSKALGVAGFPNGETLRIGSPDVKLYVARLYFEQRFALGDQIAGDENDLNQVAGPTPAKYISLRAGKFSLADFYDDNEYSHDPRTQFMNWSLMSNGSWDYPANTRGYTIGVVGEYHSQEYSFRISAAQMPTVANGPDFDKNLAQAIGFTLEGQKDYRAGNKSGTVRVLVFHNKAKMGNYREAISKDPIGPDITSVRKYGNTKTGVMFSWEQELSKSIGGFFRAGWNDGANETWVFTEIDRSLSGGIVINGNSWKIKNDVWGMALSVNGLSSPHKDYLSAGGYGFIIGDGKLNYGLETIFETYYSFKIPKIYLTLSPDYQFVLHPAYNKDRGPVHFIALRAHIEI